MMDSRTIAELKKGKDSPFVNSMLSRVKDLVDMSRSVMSNYYDEWDQNDSIYRGQRTPDKDDREASKKGQPVKMVVPLAYAQIQTFVSFCLTLFLQKEDIVELVPASPEDTLSVRAAEDLLARDLRRSKFVLKLRQFLLDVARFTFGVLKHTWVEETRTVSQEVPVEGSELLTLTQGTKETIFQGNRVESCSPYRFFPDVRLPLGRFQEGEFCASEDEYTIIELKKQEKDGLYANVDAIPKWTKETLAERSKKSRLFSSGLSVGKAGEDKSAGVCVLTEVQVWIVPSKFILEDGKPLGPEEEPVLYVVAYANDNTVIRVEPMNYVHNQFTYDVAEFDPDQHSLINTSLSGIIDMLQDAISWFINSHITSVRRVIQNRLIIDPSGLEMEDIKQDKAYVRLNMQGAGGDVRRYVQQLQVSDVTGGHVGDAEKLHQFMMTVTGISENSLGQYSPGRRSATEARNVNFNAASRLKIIAQSIYYAALEPLFEKMLSNLRDGISFETYQKVRGAGANPAEFQSFKSDRGHLMGNYDFSVFDATLPSEKGYMAQQLGDLLQVMLSNPQSIAMFGYDPRKILDKMFELRGIRNLEQFRLEQTPNAQPTEPTRPNPIGAPEGAIQPGEQPPVAMPPGGMF